MNSNRKVNKGRGRGVLALNSYEPCPRPSKNIITHNDQPVKNVSDSKKPVNIVKPLEVKNEITARINIPQKINEGENTRNIKREEIL